MLLFLSLLPLALGLSTFRLKADSEWNDYKVRFGKFYANEVEEYERRALFKQHLEQVKRHNSNPNNTFQIGVNNFSDMTHSEFRNTHGGCFKVPAHAMENGVLKSKGRQFSPMKDVNTPDSIDWRTLGAVTAVKNQGQCGSCWAFSTTGSLEGQTFRTKGKLLPLSEQNLVDCVTTNHACHGGWMDYAFTYIRDNKGIDSETGYPYYARPLGYCYYRKEYNAAEDTGFVDLPAGDEESLRQAVGNIGPISVAIDATHPSFMSYRSGVYVEPDCGNTLFSLDHAVLVVGYGHDTASGLDYWLVKNSWGVYWGESGYIRMARNRNNQCGIACKASYPTV